MDILSINGEQDLPLLWSSSADTHGSVAAVHTLHLVQSSLLVALVGEAHKSVTARLSGRGIRHDLSGLAGGETSLEQRHEDELVDLRTEVSDKDGELGTALVTAVHG